MLTPKPGSSKPRSSVMSGNGSWGERACSSPWRRNHTGYRRPLLMPSQLKPPRKGCLSAFTWPSPTPTSSSPSGTGGCTPAPPAQNNKHPPPTPPPPHPPPPAHPTTHPATPPRHMPRRHRHSPQPTPKPANATPHRTPVTPNRQPETPRHATPAPPPTPAPRSAHSCLLSETSMRMHRPAYSLIFQAAQLYYAAIAEQPRHTPEGGLHAKYERLTLRWLGVSIRKSCERACRGPAWRLAAAMPVLSLFARVLSGGRRLCPGAEVFRAGVPGQEAFQRPAGERFPAVAAAFVQVGGEPGQDVQPRHPGGRGDGPDDGGVPGGVPVPGPAGVLPGHDGPANLALRGVIVQRYHRVVPVRDQAVPLAVQGGERLLRRLGQAGGGHLRLPRLVDHGERLIPGGVCPVQRRGGLLLFPRGGRGSVLPGGHQAVVRSVKVPDPLQPHVRPVLQLDRVRVPGPDKMPSYVSPAKEVHQAVRLLPRGLIHLIEVAGDHQAARPAVLIRGQLPGLLLDARVAGQHRPGPRRVHHEAHGIGADENPEPPLPRAAAVTGRESPPRRLIRVQVPRAPRPLRNRVRQRDEQRPGLRARPRQSSRGDLRALPAQPRHQRVHAPPGNVPLGEEHRDERAGEQALPDRLRRPRRRHRARHPAAAGPPPGSRRGRRAAPRTTPRQSSSSVT